jgi:hypothetical protein
MRTGGVAGLGCEDAAGLGCEDAAGLGCEDAPALGGGFDSLPAGGRRASSSRTLADSASITRML